MKPIYALTAMAGLLALMNSPLTAQDNKIPLEPSAENAPKAADALPPPSEEKKPEKTERTPRSGPSRTTRGPREDEVMTPFIGVLTSPVPRELRAHFNLPEGFGLLVQEVMHDTPAKTAGIKADDVLLRFEDQKLVNMEQLQTLVRSKKKGDVVPFTLISGGKESQVSVTIDERLIPSRPEEGRRGDDLPRLGFFGDRDGFDMKEMREAMERYQNHMREYQERLRDWNRNGHPGDQPPSPPTWSGPSRRGEPRDRDQDRGRGGDERGRNEARGWDGDRPRDSGEAKRDASPGPRGEGERHMEHRERREATNVTRSDDSGIYSLRREGDRTVFTAKPKDGEEKSWNLNNEEERRAIPDAMKEKLRQLEEIRGEDFRR